MNNPLQEILEIPDRAEDLLLSANFVLPQNVPYLGMGSSYFAALAFRFLNIQIEPEIAAEYYYCSLQNKPKSLGVIISQSGQSSEALWNLPLFERVSAITNNQQSPLAKARNVQQVVPLLAGEEKYSSSKTYVNTLLALFKGFGYNIKPVTTLLRNKMSSYDALGRSMAHELYEMITHQPFVGTYILGTGSDIATAYEAALVLSETVKLPFHGMSMAQYDHGPKETAKHSAVIMILPKKTARERCYRLQKTIANAGGTVLTVEDPDVSDEFSIVPNIIPFNFMSYYLAQMLGIQATFVVGNKVTT